MCARTQKAQIAVRFPYQAPVLDLSPCGRGIHSLIFTHAIYLIALAIPAPKRAAARRADIPSTEAFITQDREPSLGALAIIHLIKAGIESRAMKTSVIKGSRR
jgi:hypothetical protein